MISTTRSVTALVGVSCVVAVVAIWVSLSSQEHPAVHGGAGTSSGFGSDGGTAGNGVDRERQRSKFPAAAELADLYYHCPGFGDPLEERRSVLGGFSSECEAVLDARYLDEVPSAMPVATLDGALTWRRVFSDSLGKREAAIDVLRRQCVFHDGGVSPDGVGDCDLDGLVDFGLLKYQCGGRRFHMLNRVAPGLVEAVGAAQLDDIEDNSVYWARRQEVEEGYYVNAWLAAKCAGVPAGALASLAPEDAPSAFRPPALGVPPLFGNITAIRDQPEPGQEGWWWAEQAWEGKQLMTWASVLDRRRTGAIVRVGYGYDTLEAGSWQREHPLLAEIVQFKRLALVGSEGPLNQRSLRVHAYMALVWAKAVGMELDEKWLYAQIGPSTEAEWQEARIRAHEIMKGHGRNLVLGVDGNPDA